MEMKRFDEWFLSSLILETEFGSIHQTGVSLVKLQPTFRAKLVLDRMGKREGIECVVVVLVEEQLLRP